VPQRSPSNLPDDDDRKLILHDLKSCMIVEAAAGTGKTTIMVGRMVALLNKGECEIDKLAAVTFTRKAAAELRSRFQLKLEEALRNAGSAASHRLRWALGNIEKCFIGTIHSFCARLLRERPVEAGVDISFSEIDDEEDELLRGQVWDEYVANLHAGNAPVLAELRDMGLELSDVRNAFKRYVDFPDVQEWPVQPVDPLDLDEVREFLRTVAAHAKHIEGLVSSSHKDQDELMRRYARITRMMQQEDLDSPLNMVKILKELRKKKSPAIEPAKWPGGKDQAKEELAGWQENRESAEGFLHHWSKLSYPVLLKTLEPVRFDYERAKDRAGRLNYQDLLVKAAALLRDKPHIRAYFRKRFTHLLVDEFQDTDPIQAEVMMLLTSSDPDATNWEECVPAPGALFVVGDPKQSIYRFRRADIVTYDKVKKILKNQGYPVVNLRSNFRSSQEIIDWVNRTFKARFDGPSGVQPEYVELAPSGPPRTTNASPPAVICHTIPGKIKDSDSIVDYEADLMARFIVTAVRNGMPIPRTGEQLSQGRSEQARYDDFLIVTARKERLGAYARKLQQYGIPHQVTGGDALNKAAELSLLTTCLAAATQPDNPVALVAALRSELFGISDDALYWFKRAGGEFSFMSEPPDDFRHPEQDALAEAFSRLKACWELFKVMPPVSAMERLVADMGLTVLAAMDGEGNSRAGSLMKALELVRSMQDRAWTVNDLLAYLKTLENNEQKHDAMPALAEKTPCVQVMNLHKVKGLEAPIVFLADPCGAGYPHPVLTHIDRSGPLTQGYLALYDLQQKFHPPVLAIPADWERLERKEMDFQAAENTRLMYVAATRARDLLVIVRRESNNYRNPWGAFEEALKGLPAFEDPGEVKESAESSLRIQGHEVLEADEDIERRWERVLTPSYSAVGVRAMTVDRLPLRSVDGQRRPDGIKWGTVIHSILERAMAEESVDLEDLAGSALSEQGLSDAAFLIKEAVETVHSVMASPVWGRARRSPKRLVEVPFQVLEKTDDDAGLPVDTIVRGAIDLVFLESDAWVIVDYKTDGRSHEELPDLVEHYRGQVLKYSELWEKITGQKVSESAFYFTHLHEYVRL